MLSKFFKRSLEEPHNIWCFKKTVLNLCCNIMKKKLVKSTSSYGMVRWLAVVARILNFGVYFVVTHLGSVWIGLILLKLKTYCWNHCSKIIFKCVNSIVGPIFNEKVAKKWNLWVHEQYIMHCLRQKSQHLWLLFIEQYMNSNRVLPKRVKKKKKRKEKEKRKTQTQYPN